MSSPWWKSPLTSVRRAPNESMYDDGAVDRKDVRAGLQPRMDAEERLRRRLAEGVCAQAWRVAGGRVHRRRDDRGRRRRGRSERRGGLGGRLGVADLDVAPGRQPAVVGGQVHVELRDERAIARCSGRRAAVDSGRADGQLAPAAEVRVIRGHRLPADLQVVDRAAVDVPAGIRRARAGRGPRRHGGGGDQASEEREARHVALGARRGVLLDRRARGGGRRGRH